MRTLVKTLILLFALFSQLAVLAGTATAKSSFSIGFEPDFKYEIEEISYALNGAGDDPALHREAGRMILAPARTTLQAADATDSERRSVIAGVEAETKWTVAEHYSDDTAFYTGIGLALALAVYVLFTIIKRQPR